MQSSNSEKPAKSAYTPKAAETVPSGSAAESEDITDFLITFFTLYSTATEKELSYYVSGGSMPPVKCADYTFSQLKCTVLNKDGIILSVEKKIHYAPEPPTLTLSPLASNIDFAYSICSSEGDCLHSYE